MEPVEPRRKGAKRRQTPGRWKLTKGANHVSISAVKDTCSISDLTRNAAAIVKRAERKGSVTVCRNGRVVGFVVSRDRMEAMLETLEIIADPEAMKAIGQYEAGKMRFKDVSCLDDGKG